MYFFAPAHFLDPTYLGEKQKNTEMILKNTELSFIWKIWHNFLKCENNVLLITPIMSHSKSIKSVSKWCNLTAIMKKKMWLYKYQFVSDTAQQTEIQSGRASYSLPSTNPWGSLLLSYS